MGIESFSVFAGGVGQAGKGGSHAAGQGNAADSCSESGEARLDALGVK